MKNTWGLSVVGCMSAVFVNVTAAAYNGWAITIPGTVPAGQFDWVSLYLQCLQDSTLSAPRVDEKQQQAHLDT